MMNPCRSCTNWGARARDAPHVIVGLVAKNGGKSMNMESKKKDIEAYSGDWLLKYNDLKQRLEFTRKILNKYPRYMPPLQPGDARANYEE
jgi:hypothetical protein